MLATDRGRWLYVRYLLAFALALIAPFYAIFELSSTEWFLSHDGYPELRNVGYSERVGQRNCQIVLYGDSAALTGLDPALIRKATGLTACNIAEGSSILLVTGSDLPLQSYLRRNKPPLFIFGMWGYATYRPDIPPFTQYHPEGLIYDWRYGNRLHLLGALIRHPEWTLLLTSWVESRLKIAYNEARSGEAAKQVDARVARDSRLGRWPFPLPPETHCLRDDQRGQTPWLERQSDSTAAFRRKYATPQTTVIMDISPIPDCSPIADVFAASAAGLHENPQEIVPIRFFNQGDVHFSQEGVRFLSEMAAQQILARMHPQTASQLEHFP